MTNELMTGYVEKGVSPLSRITIGSLQDLGYAVDYSAADSYGRGNLNCTCNHRSLYDMLHGETRQLSLGIPNTVRRVLSDDMHEAAMVYGRSVLKERSLSPNLFRRYGDFTYVGDKVVSVLMKEDDVFFSVVVKQQD